MLVFSSGQNANDPSVFVLVSQLNENVTGSVAVKTWPGGDISVARLYTAPEYRRQGIARQMMLRIFLLYPEAAVWLYAGPYAVEGARPGADTAALQKFYMSLGFTTTTDDHGKPVMVRSKL